MLTTILAAAVCSCAVGIVGTAGAALVAARWRAGTAVQLAAGVIAVGLAAMVVAVATFVRPLAGITASILVLLASAATVVAMRWWRRWREWLIGAILVAGVVAAYLGILYLWQSPHTGFELVSSRFDREQRYPVDNVIPSLFADRLAGGGGSGILIGDWLGSDRPPLLSGIVLLCRPIGMLLGVDTGTWALGASIAGQLIWIPALWSLFSALRAPRGVTVLAILGAASIGTDLTQTLYTWPKMTSAAFVIVACTLLVVAGRDERGRIPLVIAAVGSSVLALLSHGAAAFALPLLIWLGIRALVRSSPRQRAREVVGGVLASVVLYAPWAAYQHFVDPPGDRLLKWHLAGVVRPDHASFLHDLLHSYAGLTPERWWAAKAENLEAVFSWRLLPDLSFTHAAVQSRLDAEFYHVSTALGWAAPAVIVVIVGIVVRRVRGSSDAVDRDTTIFVAGSFASILWWCLLMFRPGSAIIHQGSQVWLILLAAFPVYWLAARRRPAAIVLVVLQAVLCLAFHLPNPGDTAVRPLSAVLLVLGASTLVVVAVVTLRGDTGAALAVVALDGSHALAGRGGSSAEGEELVADEAHDRHRHDHRGLRRVDVPPEARDEDREEDGVRE